MGTFSGGVTVPHTKPVCDEENIARTVDDVCSFREDEESESMRNAAQVSSNVACFMDQTKSSMVRIRMLVENGEKSGRQMARM